MPEFTFRGDPRIYPTLGVEVNDGDVHTFDEAPDERWQPLKETKPPASEKESD